MAFLLESRSCDRRYYTPRREQLMDLFGADGSFESSHQHRIG